MWLRIAAAADIAHIRGVPQAIYRVHANSMSRSEVGFLDDLLGRKAAFDSFFASCASKMNQPDALRALAARALARQALWRASRVVDRGGDDGLIEEITAFALDVYPGARRLREWRGLRLRQWIGAGRSLGFPLFIATSAVHRLRGHIGWMRLRCTGV
jgi:hypothetical protein